jgi:hypothetical protein
VVGGIALHCTGSLPIRRPRCTSLHRQTPTSFSSCSIHAGAHQNFVRRVNCILSWESRRRQSIKPRLNVADILHVVCAVWEVGCIDGKGNHGQLALSAKLKIMRPA